MSKVSDAPKHFRQAKARARPHSVARRKLEDTAEGCRALEQADRCRAVATVNDHLRRTLESSADSWAARAMLLERLEANFNQRAAANIEGSRSDNG